MKSVLSAALVLIALAAPRAARADIIYQFNFSSSDGLVSSSFSFAVPTFVAIGDTPVFTPFTLDLGPKQPKFTFVSDKACGTVSAGFFSFGTSGVNLGTPPTCFPDVSTFDNAGALELDLMAPLPTAPGDYSLSGTGVFRVAGLGRTGTFSGDLVVSSTATPVPEPSGLLLLGTGLLGLMGRGLRKKLHG